MSEIEHAQKTIAGLEDLLEELLNRQGRIDAERKTLAYSAHAEQNKKALDKLKDLAAKELSLGSDVQSLNAALAEAKMRLSNAQSKEISAADQARAEQAAALLTRFADELTNASDAIADAIGSVLDAKDLLQQMYVLGVASPTGQMFRISVVTCIKSAIMQLPDAYIRDFEFARLAPGQRRDFRYFAEQWSPTIERQIAARLPPKDEKAA